MNSITPQIYNFNGASLPKKQIVNSANAQATIENVLSSPMGATAAITTLAGVFCGIANLAKGKINTNDIPRNIKSEVVNNLEKAAPKFINEAGEEVQNIILKGKATLSDGSVFSGVMETVNKKGDKITIKYKDGFMRESYVNNKLHKIYEQLKSIPLVTDQQPIKYSRAQGTKIKLVKDDAVVKTFMNLYDDSGKARRTLAQGLDGAYDMLDIQGGKIVAKSKMKSLNLQAEVFDNNGNVIKSITKQGPRAFIRENITGDLAYETGGTLSFDIVDTPAVDYVITNPKIFRRYKNGEQVEEIKKEYKNARHILTSSKKYQGGSDDLLEIKLPKGKLSDKDNKYISIAIKKGDKVEYEAIIGEEGKNLSTNANKKTMKKLERRVKNTLGFAQDAKLDFDYKTILDNLSKIFNF